MLQVSIHKRSYTRTAANCHATHRILCGEIAPPHKQANHAHLHRACRCFWAAHDYATHAPHRGSAVTAEQVQDALCPPRCFDALRSTGVCVNAMSSTNPLPQPCRKGESAAGGSAHLAAPVCVSPPRKRTLQDAMIPHGAPTLPHGILCTPTSRTSQPSSAMVSGTFTLAAADPAYVSAHLALDGSTPRRRARAHRFHVDPAALIAV